MPYFLISNSDGETLVTTYLRHSELLADLNENEPGHKVSDFMSEIMESDTNYWGRQVLLIKGEIVVPKAKEIVTKVDVE